MPAPPEEKAFGIGAYLTGTPGIGGRLRAEPEGFLVLETGPGPRPAEDGRFTAARIELRNWETNRFAQKAAGILGLRRGQVGFAGMKDKRAVTQQWFSFPCRPERVYDLERLQDVRVLDVRRTHDKQFAGSHAGNRFVLRVAGAGGDAATLQATAAQIGEAGGVPNFFGPQRFGSGVRPITHRMGQALVAGDLEEAVRLYCGAPFPGEPQEAARARRLYDETRDAEAALAAMPARLDLERAILERLAKRPGKWRHALSALPYNLLTLFVHAWQSWLFNHIVTTRMEAGLGLREAHVGDRVMAFGDDGARTVPVTDANRERVQRELDKGRAAPTALLPGLDAPLAAGAAGAVESRILEEHQVARRQFRVHAFPRLASPGLRRPVLLPVGELEAVWEDDPVVSFTLGRGSYATIVMREFMKAPVDAY